MEAPIYPVCGTVVNVYLEALTTQSPREPIVRSERFSACCRCEMTSKYDPQHRGVGYGDTREKAIEAWQNWKPDQR